MRSERSPDEALASDARAGWSSRVSVRERHREVLREQWRFLAGFALAVVACFAVASLFASGPLQRGFILGSGVTIAGSLVVAFVVLVGGTGPLMMGELAEQWTAQELRPFREHGWRLVNHFGLGYGDHDHVLVGPGGVVLVETKWSATPWTLDGRDQFFRHAVEQTRANAKQLEGWHGLAQFGRPQVEPVLVLWGRARRKLGDQPPRRHPSGVLVLGGDQLQDWLLRRGRDRLDAEQVDGIWAQVQRHVGKRDEHERRTRPMPRSVAELAWTLLGSVVAALVGFLLAAQVLRLLGSLLLWSLAGAALLATAEAVRRRTRWPWPLRGFQLGLVATYVLGAAAVGHAYWTS